MTRDDDVRVLSVEVLSDDWYLLKKTTFERRRRDGRWQRMSRETYDRGNGATILLYSRKRGTVLLTRQFRFPAFVNGCVDGLLIETCAGLLDNDDAEQCIRREAEEELGVRIRRPKKLFEAYMSPGSVTEKLHFFAAEYSMENQIGVGGGLATEGEDIEGLELKLDDALAMMRSGAIQDGKTIMLLQHAQIVGLDGLSGGEDFP